MSADIVTRILKPLDPDQKAAAGHAGSHLLLLSPAGSGKTTVLATRIALGIGTGSLHPNRLLAVTFTNNSAQQLRERVTSLLASTTIGINPEDMWIGTFHALSARILRNHPHLAGLRPGFRILDGDEAKAVMMRVIRTHSPGLAEIPAELNRETYRLLRLAEVMRPGFGGPKFAVPASDMHFVNAYDAECLALNAADFAALISHVLEIFSKHPDVLAAWRARFDAILVDEYQDIDLAQHAWLKHLVGERCTITAFADDDQCLTEGTLVTMADGTQRPIETIEPGDRVLSAFGKSRRRAASVVNVKIRREASRNLVEISTNGGRTLVSSIDHTHFAGFIPELSPRKHLTYLMYKKGVGYRVGTTRSDASYGRYPMLGYVLRSIQEHADATWVTGSFESEAEARSAECLQSVRYGILRVPFVHRKGSKNGYIHSQTAIHSLFAQHPGTIGAKQLLDDLGLIQAAPHHRPKASRRSEQIVTITLCSQEVQSAKVPVHKLYVSGSDRAAQNILNANGIKTYDEKKTGISWSHRSFSSSYAQIFERARQISDLLNIPIVQNAKLSSHALPFTPASNIQPGMVVLTENGYEVVTSVRRYRDVTRLFDLDIKNTHNFVANGIFTHNCVYGWRGAQHKSTLEFETHWPNAKVMQLTRNYRSTPGIVDAGARLIANNRKRRPKTISSALPNTPGIKPIVHYGFRLDTDEAHWIASTIASALKVGTTPGEIAVLCRLNKLADPIASALAERQIPFALLSETALNERPEVRTALAWLQLAELPADDLAFERVATAAPSLIPHRQIDLIAAHARRQSIPIRVCAILKAADGSLPPETAARLTRLEQKLQQHASLAPAHERLTALLNDADLRSAWHNPDPKGTGSSDNLGELGQRLLAFDRVTEYLATAATGGAISGDDIPKDRVPLMTLHGAKGLQFSYVFIPGLEEETLPSLGRGEPSEERCEEERRLLYVGITRAKRQAILTSVAHRRNRYLQLSRFIAELSLAPASSAA